MRELKKRLAKILIERSYREGDFTLASGRKSDYYFDCRQTALHPEGSWLIGTLFNELLADLDIKGIGGMTLGADPLISATTVISHEKGRPLAGLIVRKESKGHGTNQYVEGLSNFKPGDRGDGRRRGHDRRFAAEGVRARERRGPERGCRVYRA